MKKVLLLISLVYSAFAFSQTCSVDVAALNAYVSPSTWGIMPDTSDNLPPAKIGVQYDTFMSFKLPLYANQLDSTLPAIQLATLQLQNISGLPAGFTFTSSASTTDSIHCNTADCKWGGGATGCMRIIGTPQVVGSFPIVITLEGKTIGGALAQTGTGDINGYVLNINPLGVSIEKASNLSVQQNSPNPFSAFTKINYSVNTSADVNFQVMSVLGEVVYKNTYRSKQGKNTIIYDGALLPKGVYFYTIQTNGVVMTKRMIIEK